MGAFVVGSVIMGATLVASALMVVKGGSDKSIGLAMIGGSVVSVAVFSSHWMGW
jgi:hypothetical protein